MTHFAQTVPLILGVVGSRYVGGVTVTSNFGKTGKEKMKLFMINRLYTQATGNFNFM